MRVFLSHTSADRIFAQALAEALSDRRVSVWYDQWEIRVGDSIVAKINEGLTSSDGLIIILSPASVKSTWVAEELNAATMKMLVDKDIRLLPVLKEPCVIPALLLHRRYADFTTDFSIGMAALLDVVLPVEKLLERLRSTAITHDKLLDQLSSSSVSTDVANLIKQIHDAMVEALDLRYEIETRAQFRNHGPPKDFFSQIEDLAEQGIDVRSPTWNAFVAIRSLMVHSYRSQRTDVERFSELARRYSEFCSLEEMLKHLREVMERIISV